jgi:BirA family biotin operon repressor/biotin-[acetyl-CoA-carboxylase] ligase
MRLDPTRIHAPWLRTIERYDVADSTNDLARRLLTAGAEPPLLVWADRQTAGRGRENRRFWSDDGSWTFSLGIDPREGGLSMDRESLLSLASAVAVIEMLESATGRSDFRLRWPNDIEVGGRKLGGILPERFPTPVGPRMVIGIGLNMSSRMDRAPAEIRRMATSLNDLGVESIDVEPLLSVLLGSIERWLEALGRGDVSLVERWSVLDSLRGRPVRLVVGAETIAGITRGIDARGGLLIEADGHVKPYHGGQVLRDDEGL